MKNYKVFLTGVLAKAAVAALLTFGMMVTGCSNPSSSGSGDGYSPASTPPDTGTSVDDFASLEPASAPDPTMVTLKEGADGQLDLAALIPGFSPSVRAATSYTVTSLNPDIATVNATGLVHAVLWGNARIQVTYGSTTVIVNVFVVPPQAFYAVPSNRVVSLTYDGHSLNRPSDFADYQTEPTYRLAWNWRNPTMQHGASGINGGIDLIGKTKADRWGMTTYEYGGWFYDLNGVRHQMTNGVQTASNGVTLTLAPSFVYDNGVSYLQITHKLKNTSAVTVTGQKFGASADVMMADNDYAPLNYLPYGALMTDSHGAGDPPKVKLRLVSQNLEGITNTDTLWLGAWDSGNHLQHIYDDVRNDVSGIDSAMAFSYQNIALNPGEEKECVVRFTLAK
ncbi:hypothetical protein FACS1894137_14940 [Spirochaetia bacterium]|nr:hypothetical protein FACS1894137_14940 [Spirochaetia bacterium]